MLISFLLYRWNCVKSKPGREWLTFWGSIRLPEQPQFPNVLLKNYEVRNEVGIEGDFLRANWDIEKLAFERHEKGKGKVLYLLRTCGPPGSWMDGRVWLGPWAVRSLSTSAVAWWELPLTVFVSPNCKPQQRFVLVLLSQQLNREGTLCGRHIIGFWTRETCVL